MSNELLGSKMDKVEANKSFIWAFSGFLGCAGAFGLYSFFYGSGSAKAALLFSLASFGIMTYLLFNIQKNWIDIYENGIQVSGTFTRSGIFYYNQISRIEEEKKRYGLFGISYSNFTIYGENGRLLTGVNGFFYKNLGEKMQLVLERSASASHSSL